MPEQLTPTASVTWQAIRLGGGNEALAVKASKKLRTMELLLDSLGSTVLRKLLDDVLWRGDHVSVKQLVEDFAKYLYLPRLTSPRVGLALTTWQTDTFAYAESFDEAAGRYRGLRTAQGLNISPENQGLVVKSDFAQIQIEAETPKPPTPSGGTIPEGGRSGGTSTTTTGGGSELPLPPEAQRPKRFHGTVKLDATRVGRDAGRIAEEVIAHLSGQVGAVVTVTLEVEAILPDGASEQVVRTVTENSRTLKFSSHGFERD